VIKIQQFDIGFKSSTRRPYAYRYIKRLERSPMNGANLLVAALENERRPFGVAGEGNLDIVEALRLSTIEFTRHEQTAPFSAATYGRLTGEADGCLSTLGPGALNLTTGAAYALPAVLITAKRITEPGRSGSPHRRI
jgi:acetolactate synthase-1/2/3 large subunit